MKFLNCHVNITTEDIEGVVDVLKSRLISGRGDVVCEYEKSLSEYFGSKYAVACSNGTAAIRIALTVLGVERGDEVMLPPTAPIMSVLPILEIGARPVFIDHVDINNFNLSISDIELKLTTKTRAIINVPMWGYPNNSYEVSEYCKSKNLSLIDDLSHCHGTKFSESNLVSSQADIAVFSTHERKMVTTGEGGFMLINREDVRDRAVRFRSFGADTALPYGEEFGLNYRLSAINAGLGITQIKKLNQKILLRSKNAQVIKQGIKQSCGMVEVSDFLGTPNYYSLALISTESREVSGIIEESLAGVGIISDTYAYKYCPLYEMPILQQYRSDCPVAESLIDRIITLPTHEGLKSEDLEYIISEYNKLII